MEIPVVEFSLTKTFFWEYMGWGPENSRNVEKILLAVISRPRYGELWFLSPFLFEPSQAEIETSPLLEKKLQDRNWDRDLYSSQILLSLGTQVLTSGKSIDRQIKGAPLRTTIYKTWNFWNEVLAAPCCLLELKFTIYWYIKHQISRNNLAGQSSCDLLSDRGIYWGNAENIFRYLSYFFLGGFIKGWMLQESPISVHVCFKVGSWCNLVLVLVLVQSRLIVQLPGEVKDKEDSGWWW